MPALQDVQTALELAPVREEYLPRPQSVHVDGRLAPSVVEYFPVWQAGQPVADSRAVPMPYVPLSQSAQLAPRTTWYFPAAQAVQVSLDVRPKMLEYVPLGQSRHPDMVPSPIAVE